MTRSVLVEASTANAGAVKAKMTAVSLAAAL
jgi:hypothetical protein